MNSVTFRMKKGASCGRKLEKRHAGLGTLHTQRPWLQSHAINTQIKCVDGNVPLAGQHSPQCEGGWPSVTGNGNESSLAWGAISTAQPGSGTTSWTLLLFGISYLRQPSCLGPGEGRKTSGQRSGAITSPPSLRGCIRGQEWHLHAGAPAEPHGMSSLPVRVESRWRL